MGKGDKNNEINKKKTKESVEPIRRETFTNTMI